MVADALPRAIQQRSVRIVDRFDVEILSANDRLRAARYWQQLESSLGAGISDSWDWIDTWLNHYGDVIQHRFVIAKGADGVRGMALLVEGVDQRRGPLPVRTIHIGTAGEPDDVTVRVQYNRPLVATVDRLPFARALFEALQRAGIHFNEIVIDGFSPDDAAAFLTVEPSFRPLIETCHIADLRAIRTSGKTVVASLRGGTGNKIRRSRRRLEETHGPIDVEIAQTTSEALAILEELILLHQRRWRREGEPGKFGSQRFTDFHRDLVHRLHPRGKAFLVRVKAGETTVGCDYSLVEHGRLLAYQWGLNQFEDSLISPGLVTGSAVMQAALDLGMDEFDWLAGDVLYKRQLSTTSRELTWARLPHGVRGHLVDYAIRARRYQKAWQQARRASTS